MKSYFDKRWQFGMSYDDGQNPVKHWTGTWEVLEDKRETLVHAFDYDPNCFSQITGFRPIGA